MGPALYGVIIGVAFFVCTRLVPQPLGSIVYWGFFGAQLSWAALTCWRWTGLPFATAALVTGAVMSLCLVVLAVFGHPYPDLRPESWVLFGGGVAIGLLFLLIESRVNRTKWNEWARHLEHQTVWNIVTGRHIPQLRNGSA